MEAVGALDAGDCETTVGAFVAPGVGAFFAGTAPAAFCGGLATGVDVFAGVFCGLTGGGTGFLAGVAFLGVGTGFLAGRADISMME